MVLQTFAGIDAVTRSPEDSIHVTLSKNEEFYGIYVPVGKLLMMLDRGKGPLKFTQVKSDNKNKRYFYFETENATAILSGWFEPSRSYKDVRSFWASESASYKGKPGLEPKDVVITKTSNWDVISYTTSLESISRAHVRAHWVQEDTWIDIHISVLVSGSVADAAKQAGAILTSIDISKLSK